MMKYKLKDLLTIQNGKDYKHLEKGNIPVYGTGGKMTEVNQFLFDGESILLPRKGSLKNIMYVDEKFWTVDTMYWTKINSDKAYGKYLYYYLKLLDLSSRDSGSTLPSMTFDSYYTLDINLPDLETQKKVADRIFNIEKKIENNNQIIEELHDVSNKLYNYWFLQFNFPNKESKPYKSSGGIMIYNDSAKKEIPEGWTIKKVADVLEVITGKKDANFASEKGKYNFFTCANTISKCNEYEYCGKSVLIAGNGDFNVKYFDGKYNAYQRTYILKPEDENLVGIIYYSSLRKIDSFKKGSNGSIVKFITKGDIDNIEIVVPEDIKLLEPLNRNLDMIQHYNNENEELATIKEFLLPLVMNGQVKV